jgi:hypothetical protein
MKRLLAIIMLTFGCTVEAKSNQLHLPSFHEALHNYSADPIIWRNRIAHMSTNMHAIEQQLRTKNLSIELGSSMLRDADILLRDHTLTDYRKKIILTVIALLKAQKNHQRFAYRHSNYTVTLPILIENTIRKINGQPLNPPYIW